MPFIAKAQNFCNLIMYLCDKHILQAYEQGDIIIEPFNYKQLQPASYDICLDNELIIPGSNELNESDYQTFTIPQNQHFLLQPNCSVLGRSKERFGSKDDILIKLSGKSSLARLGLLVHNTAEHVNPGHIMQIVLELHNLHPAPITLKPGMPIGQLLFCQLSAKPLKSYSIHGSFVDNNWAVKTSKSKTNNF